MRLLTTAFLTAVSVLSFSAGSAEAGKFTLKGVAGFDNIQGGLQFQGETVPYLGIGFSPQIGFNIQTGSILPLPETVEVTETGLRFEGVQGAHPFLGTDIHVIATADGLIFCTWRAVFEIEFQLDGNVVFRGDGRFRVVGGTGRYRNATGRFRTLFESDPVPPTADQAIADVMQRGRINR